MKKQTVVLLILTSFVFGGEFDFGNGQFRLKGGFLGLNKEKTTSVISYSISQQHKNIFSTDFFYKYNISWYQSSEIKNAQQTVSVYSNNILTALTTPVTDYKYEGLDVNLILGRDVYKNDNFIASIGVLGGISIPWIESKKDSDNDDTISSYILNAMKKSKTKIFTYKLGMSVITKMDLNKYFKCFISGSYAYQTGYIKNDYANVDERINGSFSEIEANLRYIPFSFTKRIWFITFSPKFYITAGYKFSKWIINDLAIDISGNNLKFSKSDLEMSISIGYLGFGYDF
jgi:hypothetical protein